MFRATCLGRLILLANTIDDVVLVQTLEVEIPSLPAFCALRSIGCYRGAVRGDFGRGEGWRGGEESHFGAVDRVQGGGWEATIWLLGDGREWLGILLTCLHIQVIASAKERMMVIVGQFNVLSRCCLSFASITRSSNP